MDGFLAQLVTVATSPYAFVAYLVLVVVWAFVAVKATRIRTLASSLALVPEADRKALLEKDYGFHLKEGMSARDFLKAQRITYLFWGLIALLGAIVVLSVLALLRAQPAPVDGRRESLRSAIQTITTSIDNDFAAIRGAPSTEDEDGTGQVFESTVVLPGSTYNYIELSNDDGPALVSSLYFGKDERIAYKTYQAFVSDLRSFLTDWIEHSGALDKVRKMVDYVTFVKGQRKIIVSLDRDRDDPENVHVMVMFKKVSRDTGT